LSDASNHDNGQGAGVASYPFLSQEWIEAARAIRDEYASPAAASADGVRINLSVTEVPFGEGLMQANVDAGGGSLAIGEGHLEAADATVTLDYATAKAIFVDGNPQAGMQAFMAGKIRVEGDLGRLVTIFGGMGPSPMAGDVGAKLRDITA
jgi:putative sterol carrier protein